MLEEIPARYFVETVGIYPRMQVPFKTRKMERAGEDFYHMA